MKNFLANKWHLHALIIVMMQALLMYSDNNPNWSDFENVGNFWRWFILTFFSFCGAFVWEWGQRKFFGAHKGKDGNKRSWEDIYVTTIAAAVGIAVNSIWFAGVVLAVILVLEIYRRKK